MWKEAGRTYTGRSEEVFYLGNGGSNIASNIGTEELGHLEMVAEQGNVTAEFSRELTARERSIYEQLTREYDGQELAYCISDAMFYEPERELTDEELLQMIDLEHKNQYIFERIGREIECGKRAGWPQTYHLQ